MTECTFLKSLVLSLQTFELHPVANTRDSRAFHFARSGSSAWCRSSSYTPSFREPPPYARPCLLQRSVSVSVFSSAHATSDCDMVTLHSLYLCGLCLQSVLSTKFVGVARVPAGWGKSLDTVNACLCTYVIGVSRESLDSIVE